MAYTLLDEDALAQLSRCRAVYAERQAAKALRQKFHHQLAWVDKPDGKHLCRLDPGTGEHLADLGGWTEDLNALCDRYAVDRATAWRSEAAAVEQLGAVQRENIAFGTARVPNIVVSILEVLWERGLMEFYRVIGTHAMYAYEAAAGVRFEAPALATNDVDLLWDAQKRVKFVELMKRDDLSMIDVLKEADPTFERDEDNKESAINDAAFSVDFIRRETPEPPPDAFPISGKEGDVFPVKARRAQSFFTAKPFEQAVVALDGRVTCMRTVQPGVFAEFKLWMSAQADREFLKKGRDRRQAEAVLDLIREGRLPP